MKPSTRARTRDGVPGLTFAKTMVLSLQPTPYALRRCGGTGTVAVPLKPTMCALPCRAQCACSCSQWPWSVPTISNTAGAPDMHLGARKVGPRACVTTLEERQRQRVGCASLSLRLLLDSRVVGFAEVIQPNCCHPFLLEALLFQWP